MLPILFAIGGGIKSFFEFCIRNWKIVLILLVIVAAFFAIRHYGETRYQAGSDATIAEMRKQVGLQNDANRKTEKKLDTSLKDFGEKKSKEDNARHDKEKPFQDDISKHFPDDPTIDPAKCDIPGRVVLDINAIRALGPKGN